MPRATSPEAARPSSRFPRIQELFNFEKEGGRSPHADLVRELLLFAGGLVIFFAAFRLAVIYLSMDMDPAGSVSGFLRPAYLVQDLAALLLFLALTLLPGFLPGFVSRPPFRALLGAICFLILGLATIGALRYFAVYELHFQWSHLDGGSGELWHSVRNEVDGVMARRVLMLFAFTLAWAWLARAYLRESAASHGRRALVFIVLFIPGLVLAFLADTSPGSDPAREFEKIRERGHNIALRLLLPYGDSPVKIARDATNPGMAPPAGNAGPFSFHFSTDSLTDTERKPRLAFPGKGRKRNIVLYIFESTSEEYIGRSIPFGKKRGQSVTPVWDRLTRNGMRFQNHHAENPLSVNAMFTLLTSAYSMPADRWAATEFPELKPAGLASMLREKGYATALIHPGNLDYARQKKFLRHRGFDLLLDAKTLKRPPYTKMLNWGIDDRAMLDPAVKFARESKAKGKPFFMLLQPVSPHHPYEIPEDRFRVLPKAAQSNPRRSWYYRYLSSLFYSDHVLGLFIKAMEQAGFAEDTLFIIVADHGEAFGQHRRNYNHPFYVYQENVHVPFLIYNRKLFKTARRYESVSRHVDIAPTILDLVGLPGDKRFQGRSLLRAGPPGMATFRATWRNDIQGLRDGKWKYIHNRRTGRAELYDLSSDPAEKKDISRDHPRLTAKYADYLARLTLHQKRYFEHVTGKRINWNKKREYTE